ncbi:hypothetical protein GCM10025867_49550 (plasmid) [Frondihabitans sucicola]|uniref:Uncharacterized protein n=1 Tax=Frondihabitans sucicola TaxID=1268041 RepID=A0ABM8GWF1_9MICO|nr:hypothetical protein [Frondihabitans sucicola]BDZ52714.1 hypothetical protein GCM10025867_49550 [Frondihabitans sucicola]
MDAVSATGVPEALAELDSLIAAREAELATLRRVREALVGPTTDEEDDVDPRFSSIPKARRFEIDTYPLGRMLTLDGIEGEYRVVALRDALEDPNETPDERDAAQSELDLYADA